MESVSLSIETGRISNRRFMTVSVEKLNWREGMKLTLPKEHGSWSLALEPVIFGLIVAPTAAGAALVMAAVSGFFLRRPMKIWLSPKSDPRQPLAAACTAILALAGLTGLLLAARLGGANNLWPLLPAALAGAVFAWCDSHNEAREGAAEVAGAVAFGLLPAAFGALAGWHASAFCALAAVMLVRSVPTVLTVRANLRIRKGRAVPVLPALVSGGAGIFLTGWLVYLRLAPWAAVLFATIFAARTAWLLLWRPDLTARTVGIIEAVLGGMMVFILALTW